MLIDLSEILLHKKKDQSFDAEIEMEVYKLSGSEYKVKSKKLLNLLISYVEDKTIFVKTNIDVTLLMPCDRCLEDVDVNVNIDISKEIDMNESEEQECFEDKFFNVEKFVYKEILIELPMKILCSDDCKGICNRCGTNLNRMTCDCDTTVLDPRMEKILDLFNEFKEV